jgi:hypothetical protein
MKTLLPFLIIIFTFQAFSQSNSLISETSFDQSLTAPTLWINELLASNNIFEDEFGEKDDWIEIYNPNAFSVDVAGMYISDKSDNPTKYQFPTGNDSTIIPANGYILIWADEQSSQGPLHTNFKLSNDGEYVSLTDSDGTTLIDEITFGAQTQNISFGRQTDGGLPWVNFETPTPNQSNNDVSSSLPLINNKPSFSIYPNPSAAYIYFSEPLLFSIYSVSGQEVLNVFEPTQRIAVNHLQNGLYHIRAANGQLVRFVKN